MTTSNHLYAGAALAMAVHHPVIGMMVALGSHFLLDVLPHYGRSEREVAKWFRYFYYERRGMQASQYLLTRFHDKIQWGERPWGAYIEIPCFLALVALLVYMVY
jgi:hypothetical protein